MFHRGVGEKFDTDPEAMWKVDIDAQGWGIAREAMLAITNWFEARLALPATSSQTAAGTFTVRAAFSLSETRRSKVNVVADDESARRAPAYMPPERGSAVRRRTSAEPTPPRAPKTHAR